jgi:WD40 repeat protein
MVKRDSFGGKTWGGQKEHKNSGAVSQATFNPNGKTIVVSLWNRGAHLCECDATSWSTLRTANFGYGITSVVCCPIKPGWLIVGDSRGQLSVLSNTAKHTFESHCELTPVDFVKVSACAWSQDGKWIATGNDVGDIFLWNAGFPTSVTFALLLPRNRPNSNSKPNSDSRLTTSLAFVPDCTALIIVSGGYLSVWDIKKVEYVANSGLPDMAMNVALDGPRNRLAVVVNERISIYELKLPEEKCQTDGKSSIPSELAEFDITNAIVKFDPEPFVGPYLDIYRGAWKPDTPRIFQHVVAIKALRPASKLGRQNFEDVRKLNFVPLVNIQ